MDLSTIKALRQAHKTSQLKIIEDITKSVQNEKFKKDERFWSATQDKAGNGSAVIRFLIGPEEDSPPWVKVFDHSFKGPTGRWYIEKCLSTIKQPDPVLEYINPLWQSKNEDDIKLASQLKRKTKYLSNVLVLKDPANSENEGKVFIFSYGKKIFDMIMGKLSPEFEDQEEVNIFSPFQGCNFRLRLRKVESWSNFDKSEFDSTLTPIADSDEEILKIINQCYDLREFVNPANFKSYDELKRKFHSVMGFSGGVSGSANASFATTVSEARVLATDEEEAEELVASAVESARNKKSAAAKVSAPLKPSFDVDRGESEEDVEFFQQLLKET